MIFLVKVWRGLKKIVAYHKSFYKFKNKIMKIKNKVCDILKSFYLC